MVLYQESAHITKHSEQTSTYFVQSAISDVQTDQTDRKRHGLTAASNNGPMFVVSSHRRIQPSGEKGLPLCEARSTCTSLPRHASNWNKANMARIEWPVYHSFLPRSRSDLAGGRVEKCLEHRCDEPFAD